MKKKPGVMIYFEICDALELLTNEQRGQIMMAILDYGQRGITPEFEDATLAICWSFVKKRLDADDERYWKTVEQGANAARKRWAKPNETNDTDDVYAVEVVRCRECKHLMLSDCYGECGKGHMGVVRPDDFCSRGERNEGAD